VTGGDSGIGRSVALLMAKEGAKAVAIVHLPKEQAVSWACCLPRGCVWWQSGSASGGQPHQGS
jgi:NAD(P)-dependent dehydrogenase (short-subunit alcohol dehydrogenase family)